MRYDLIIVGGGPAGLTAAIHARARDKSALVISNDPLASPLCRAPAMANYPGLPGVTGKELVERLLAQARDLGVELKRGRALSVMPMGESVMVSVGSDVVEGRAAVLAPGVSRAAPLKGEAELLGRGVSYCATCDGMFYRGRSVVCAGDAPNFDEEVEFLRSIGCEVAVRRLAGLSILGEDAVTGVRDAKGEETPCQGVFLLRASIAPAQLAPGMETEGGYIKVDGRMATSLPGVYAAGDCTGQPLQLAKAVGQGQLAAHFAIEAMG
ncbi:MAG: NAD(P)/FAD-dependent oxidoreductase [Oscillospiraceae bacterium]|nr:NAD(P)/FAD-dependent oxidoreductase [Oscillospiraceae bacterium]MCI9548055.1 NAD(P)/FAD-dependent oxidoreductase [Oscillospiraceae bacterium]